MHFFFHALPTTLSLIHRTVKKTFEKKLIYFPLFIQVAHNRSCIRPNMLVLVANVAYHCKKNRLLCRDHALIEKMIQSCTESITNLLHLHGGARVVRQMQNALRYREFVCSMLYLMRVGITYQSRQILPKMDMLHMLLPLQVLLPSIFRIRAKSITEGEVSLSLSHILYVCVCVCVFMSNNSCFVVFRPI